MQRLVIILLLLVALFPVFAQDALQTPITGSWQKNTKIKAVLDDIAAQYDVFFSYNHKTVQSSLKKTLTVENQPLGKVLSELFQGTSVSYKEVGAEIYLKLELRQGVQGRVREKVTGKPLESAVIRIEGTPLGALSDEKGYFRIDNVPVGRISLSAQYVGYEPYLYRGLVVTMGKEMVVNIDMTEAVITVGEVVIMQSDYQHEAINAHATVGAHRFSSEESQRMAAAYGGAARTVMALPGVSSGNDLENELIIRGNSARGLQWRLEGLEIPNPNHFATEGTSSGVLSLISTHIIGDSDFLTGAFPARYGNALSGVFDMNLRVGNTQRREYGVQSGSLGTEVSLEGPFAKGKRASYLVNFRYSSLALLDLINIRILKDRFTFYQDLGFKFNFPTKNAGTFSVFGVSGNSHTGDVETDSTGYHDSGMAALGIKHRLLVTPKVALVTTMMLAGTDITDRITGTNSLYSKKIKAYSTSAIRLHYKPGAKHNIEAGFTFRSVRYNFRETRENPGLSSPWANFNPFRDVGNSLTRQGYASWKYRITPHLSTILGAHIVSHELVDFIALEPRVGVKWVPDSKQSIGFGFGMHSRLDNFEYYLARRPDSIQPNRNLTLGRAMHTALNYEYTFGKNYHLTAEVYYQYLFGFPAETADGRGFSVTFLYNNGYTFEEMENVGKGFNYGIDISLRKPLIDSSYYLFLTASLYDSKYKGSDDVLFHSPFNETFNTGFIIGKEITLGKRGNRNMIDVNFRGSWRGSRRYTPIDLSISQLAGETVRDDRLSFIRQFDDYLRFDVKISFRQNYSRRTSTVLSLDIQNVVNYENTLDNAYIANQPQPFIRIKNFGTLPILSYRIDFGGKTVRKIGN